VLPTLDGVCFLIKEELELLLIGCGKVLSFGNYKVPAILKDSYNSSTAHLRNNVEWSTKVESIFVFSLLLHWVFLVGVDNAPLLISGALLASDRDILTFLAFVSFNLHNLALDILD
jgi:hypothetical protein